jgi:hypothetical protein
MEMRERQNRQGYDVAIGVVTFLGLYQGAVPLVARLLFDADQRFAPALWLPAPWWWIACLAIVLTMVALLAVLHDTRQRRFPTEPAPGSAPAGMPETSTQKSDSTAAYDAASAVVFLVGIYNGVAPFVVRLIFGGEGNLLLALPLRLPAPWWWITSIAVLVTTVVLLAVLDQAKQRRHRDE